MKKIISIAIPLGLAGCSHIDIGLNHAFNGGTKGNGKPEEVSRTVEEFDKIEVSSAFHVEATEGKLTPVSVTADSNLLPQIKTEVKDRTLKVWVDGSISNASELKLVLSTPKILSMQASGASEVNLKLASVHDLSLKGSGAVKLNVSGAVSSLQCDLAGASQASIPSSEFSKVDAKLDGASKLEIAGTVDHLNADLTGASSIKGGLKGKEARVKLTGASSGQLGAFEKVTKELSGASSATFDK